MIKFLYDTETEIPAHVKALYSQNADGKWQIQVDGAVSRAVVDEFRNNNIALTKEKDGLAGQLKAFEGVDPVKYRELAKNKDLLDTGKLIEAGKLEEAVTGRTEKMRTEHAAALKAAEEKATKALGEMGRLKIDTALTTEAAKLGLLPAATTDFVSRGRAIFTLDDNGNVVAYEPGTTTPRYGSDAKPLQIGEFVKEAAASPDFKHLFAPSGGGGAQGGGKVQPTAGNPFLPGPTFNLTEQARLTTAEPTRAAALKAEAAPAATV